MICNRALYHCSWYVYSVLFFISIEDTLSQMEGIAYYVGWQNSLKLSKVLFYNLTGGFEKHFVIEPLS